MHGSRPLPGRGRARSLSHARREPERVWCRASRSEVHPRRRVPDPQHELKSPATFEWGVAGTVTSAQHVSSPRRFAMHATPSSQTPSGDKIVVAAAYDRAPHAPGGPPARPCEGASCLSTDRGSRGFRDDEVSSASESAGTVEGGSSRRQAARTAGEDHFVQDRRARSNSGRAGPARSASTRPGCRRRADRRHAVRLVRRLRDRPEPSVVDAEGREVDRARLVPQAGSRQTPPAMRNQWPGVDSAASPAVRTTPESSGEGALRQPISRGQQDLLVGVENHAVSLEGTEVRRGERS